MDDSQVLADAFDTQLDEMIANGDLSEERADWIRDLMVLADEGLHEASAQAAVSWVSSGEQVYFDQLMNAAIRYRAQTRWNDLAQDLTDSFVEIAMATVIDIHIPGGVQGTGIVIAFAGEFEGQKSRCSALIRTTRAAMTADALTAVSAAEDNSHEAVRCYLNLERRKTTVFDVVLRPL